MTFTHLEVHSHYSLLSATASVEALAARAAADEMDHLALTDTDVLYGAVAFSRACRDHGVAPILGLTLPVQDPYPSKTQQRGSGDARPGRLTLLASGPVGYRSLCRLSSRLQAEPDREALAARGLDWETLAEERAGLFALSGGRAGWIERHLRAGDRTAALHAAGRLAGVYGQEARIALELQAPADHPVAAEASDMARRLGIEAVAVQPVFCLARDDYPNLRLLAAICQNRPLSALAPDALPGGDLHWLSPDEMRQRFGGFPGVLDAAAALADACHPALPAREIVWPALSLPPGLAPETALAARARLGLCERYGDHPAAGAAARLEHELTAINGRGYAPLFLVVADIVRFSREAGVPVSTRGSVANSLVAFCTGITTVDPLEHDLLFERFLNPARAGLPDIDLDFCSRRRDEVLEYVRRTYGAEHVAIIGTISTMQLQSAVREVGKALELRQSEVDHLAAIVPHRWHPDPRRRDRRTVEDVVQSLDSPQQRDTLRAAAALVGQPDHLSLHPGGVVITPGPLTDYLPVQWAPKGFLVTQFEHGAIEELGLPKIDLLGIRALTVLADAAELVRLHHDAGFRLEEIPLHDADTGDLLARGQTVGVFQCESEGAQATLRKLRARTVRDLAVANAFFKPGPATGGMAGAFVRRYRGEEPVAYLHPALAPILGPTQGVLLFQEQILRVAREVAGLSWQEADQLRKGMSHFGVEQMTALREQFLAGCQRPVPAGPGMSVAQAATLWEQVVAFAGYGFNQGHATAYADVSYRSAYLKAHWPAAFFCARLADQGGFHHPAVYIAEARCLGVTVMPPHVNYSGAAFTYQPTAAGPILWMGLGQVRDLRQKSVEAIGRARGDGPFLSVGDLAARVELHSKEIVHLIQCGALDGLGPDRDTLLRQAGDLRQPARARIGQLALPLDDAFAATPTAPVAPGVIAPPAYANIARWEKLLLGMPVSLSTDGRLLPLSLVADRLPEHLRLADLPSRRGQRVVTAGLRLPGWTGGPCFYLADGATWLPVRGPRAQDVRPPPPWQPTIVEGRWQGDEFGTAWLQAERISAAGGFDAD